MPALAAVTRRTCKLQLKRADCDGDRDSLRIRVIGHDNREV